MGLKKYDKLMACIYTWVGNLNAGLSSFVYGG